MNKPKPLKEARQFVPKWYLEEQVHQAVCGLKTELLEYYGGYAHQAQQVYVLMLIDRWLGTEEEGED